MTQILYRFFNGDTLLYVGISINAYARASQHKNKSTWWEEATHVTFEKFDTRAEVDTAETLAIRAERPKYNIAKVDGSYRLYLAEMALTEEERNLVEWVIKLDSYVSFPQSWLDDIPKYLVPESLDRRMRDLQESARPVMRSRAKWEFLLETALEVRNDWEEWHQSILYMQEAMAGRYRAYVNLLKAEIAQKDQELRQSRKLTFDEL